MHQNYPRAQSYAAVDKKEPTRVEIISHDNPSQPGFAIHNFLAVTRPDNIRSPYLVKLTVRAGSMTTRWWTRYITKMTGWPWLNLNILSRYHALNLMLSILSWLFEGSYQLCCSYCAGVGVASGWKIDLFSKRTIPFSRLVEYEAGQRPGVRSDTWFSSKLYYF